MLGRLDLNFARRSPDARWRLISLSSEASIEDIGFTPARSGSRDELEVFRYAMLGERRIGAFSGNIQPMLLGSESLSTPRETIQASSSFV